MVGKKTILITGAGGFIGKNLCVYLNEFKKYNILKYLRNDSNERLGRLIKKSDIIFHLAGDNRPKDLKDFEKNNTRLTSKICSYLTEIDKEIPLIFSSSTQAEIQNPYGASKLAAEKIIQDFSKKTGKPSKIYRFPGVFGKWCKPNYNSVVATFCYNIARGLPVSISNKDTVIELVYIDDIIKELNLNITYTGSNNLWNNVSPVYQISLGDLSKKIFSFKSSRKTFLIENVGKGLMRALYSTYISYLPKRYFSYALLQHEDGRGVFVEMLKTKLSGQISFFTIKPNVIRGSHYHHTKTEKFLVVSGKVKMCFRNILDNSKYEIELSSKDPRIVDTIPGWVHDIKNIGSSEAIVLLWANEVFDKKNPDTIFEEV